MTPADESALQPLRLASTEALETELCTRYRAVVVTGIRDIGGGRSVFHLSKDGCLTTCLGLTRRAGAILLAEALEAPEPEPGDEL